MPHALLMLDCEFTSLEDSRLISIGLMDLRGCSFYGEFSRDSPHWAENLENHMSTFTRENVVPLLGRAGQVFETPYAMGQALAAWLRQLGSAFEVNYDWHTDFDLLEDVLSKAGCWPVPGVELIPSHVGYLWGEETALAAADAKWKDCMIQWGLGRHHGLADTAALCAAYRAVHLV